MMMPAFENNLLAFFLILLVLAALAGLGATLWKPFGKRAWRYFKVWWQQDQLAEAQARTDADARRKARRELAEACGEEAPRDETTAEAAAQQKADCAPLAPPWFRTSKADTPTATETPKISLIQRK